MGIYVCVLSMISGSFIGIIIKDKISSQLCNRIMEIFGIGSIAIGIININKTSSMPAVILTLIISLILGEFLHLEEHINSGVKKMKTRVSKGAQTNSNQQILMKALIVFCASSSGIFGAISEGTTGDSSILISKAILDFFTAIIFAVSLGKSILFISIPEFIFLLSFYLLGCVIGPYLTTFMISDFMGIGGIITLIIGLSVSGIKEFSVFNMMPAFVLIFPLSYLFSIL